MSGVEERLLYQDEQLRITVRTAPEAPAVTLVGEIDASNSCALADALASCRQGNHVVVDTGALTFIDVSGLRVLALPMLPPSQRWIRLHNVTPYQNRLLRMMGWYYESHAHHLPI
ncbi:STAS domain-containing protein [Nonomuraea sp. NPDC046802]|uniref:STAS domain-containing protein n=1 Tax=Nonomuraea sp. NPDC046802 TaxID=3154919 RepID=UPI0033E6E84A